MHSSVVNSINVLTDSPDYIFSEGPTENTEIFTTEISSKSSNVNTSLLNPFTGNPRLYNDISENLTPVEVEDKTIPPPWIEILPDTTASPAYFLNEVPTENAEFFATETPSRSAPVNTFFVNSFTGTNGGSFLIMDPQVAFKLFNTNTAKDVSEEKNESTKLAAPKEQVDVIQTTESSFDYLFSRDVFIPQQFANNAPSSLDSVNNEAITMEYDMNTANNEVDYEYNEDYIEQVPLYQDDSSNLTTLDSSNNLYRIEIDIPGNSVSQNKILDKLSQLLPTNLKEEPQMDGRIPF